MVFSFVKTFGVLVMRIVVFCLVAAVAVSTFRGSSSSTHSSITVDLPGQGTILGDYGKTSWTNQTFMRFLGIPYAESPSRELRFKVF